jgi:hypothetical protein
VAETLVVGGLASGYPWYARVRAMDGSGNWSSLSNEATAVTPSFTPATVRDLRVTAVGETTLTLTWSATGNDDNIGRPTYYDVRACLTRIDPQAWAHAPYRVLHDATVDGGGVESVVFSGLPRDTTLYVALRAYDDEGFFSNVSNMAIATTHATPPPPPGPFGIGLAPMGNPVRPPVQIRWWATSPSPGPAPVLRIHDLDGRLLRSIPLGVGDSGTASWNGDDDDGRRLASGVYFVTLATHDASVHRKLVLVPR